MNIKPSYQVNTVELLMVGYWAIYPDGGYFTKYVIDGDEREDTIREGLQAGQVAECPYTMALGEALLQINETKRTRAHDNFVQFLEQLDETESTETEE